MSPVIRRLTYLFPLALAAGCSVFFGNIKPVEEKSKNYTVIDLTKLNSDWKHIESTADFTYQSANSLSTISINSACKNFDSQVKTDLKALSNLLYLGIWGTSKVDSKQEETIILDSTPALQTTTQGKLDLLDTFTIRTIVVERNYCTYDFILIARSQYFQSQLKDFNKFIQSWKVN